ncbi:PAS domain-containing protein [Enhygromyxa salina]|nr:PAS domain-containing protein [Enhygromyxa salina]
MSIADLAAVPRDLRVAAQADARVLDFVLTADGDGLAYWTFAGPCETQCVWLSPSLRAALSNREDGDPALPPTPDEAEVERMIAHFRVHGRDAPSQYEPGLRWYLADGAAVNSHCRGLLIQAGGAPIGLLCGHRAARAPAPAIGLSDSQREMVESLPHFVWTCLPDGTCDYLSPQWVEYTGTPMEQHLGWNWLDQLHPDDRARTDAGWRAASQRNEPFTIEYRLRGRDGSYRCFSTRAVPIFDADGQLVKWLGSNTDVQELRDTQDRLAQVNLELEARVRERTAALQEANAQLELAQRLSHVGSWSLRPDTDEVEWSDELFRIFGLSPEQPLPSTSTQRKVFAPDSLERLQRALDRSRDTGESYEIEVEFTRPSGEHRIAISRGQRVSDEHGQIRLLGTLQDVTDLVHAQRERDASGERLRLATFAARMGVWDWDVRADHLMWDTQMYKLYGVPEGEGMATYATWASALHPDDRAAAEAAVTRALTGTGDFEIQFRIVRPNGVIRHLHSLGRVFYDDEGAPVRMLGVNHDVSAKREAELALLSNKRLLDQFVQYVPAAIAMFDTELRYIQTSARWIRDYRLDEQDIVGKSHYEVFPELPERWRQAHQRALRGAIESCTDDPFPHADGSVDWFHWEVRPWHQPDGEIGGLLLFSQVTTGRKQMELLLQRQRDDLERSNRDLEQFAYAASHDLQEPLRAVAGCAQILQKQYHGALDESADTLIGHIVDGANRMHALITDLLTYSRITSRGAEFDEVDTNGALNQALANLHSSIVETQGTVDHDPLPPVRGDAGQLAQLFQNLIGNALKYRGADPPHIRITTERAGQERVFRVSDNGIGIEPAYFERIFTLFQRLHTRVEYPGTGIGLALCKKIVQRHGGRIWVESVVGRGSSFCFTLPGTSLADVGEEQ